MGEEAVSPSSTELLLIACERARRLECRPQREDGTDAAVYESSGATVARRIKAGAKFVASCDESAQGASEQFCWAIEMQANAARKTRYSIWVDESPEQLAQIWRGREDARALRESLPHEQRKKKPWGVL